MIIKIKSQKNVVQTSQNSFVIIIIKFVFFNLLEHTIALMLINTILTKFNILIRHL